MAMTTTDLEQLKAVQAKLEEIKTLVMGSLSIRAVGGVTIANDLINVLPKLEAVATAIQADIDEHAAEPAV